MYRNILHIFSKSVKNRSLRTKILLLAFVVNLVAILLFMAEYYNQATQILREEIVQVKEVVLSRLALDVTKEIKESVSIIYRIGYNEKLRTIMWKSGGQVLDEEVADQATISGIVQNASTDPHLRQVRIYFRNGRAYTHNSAKYATLEDATKFPWYEKAIEQHGEIFWSAPYKNPAGAYPNIALISAVRTIDDKNLDTPLAIVGVDIDISLLFKRLIMQTSKSIGGDIYIVNEEGIITSSLDSKKLGCHIHSIDGLETYDWTDKDVLSMDTFVALSQQITNPDWRIVAKIPLDSFAHDNRRILKNAVISACMLFGGLFLANAIISIRFTQRLRALLNAIRIPTLDNEDDSASRDELLMLGRRYEEIASKNREMANEIYEVSLQKKDAQLSALQAQINPHFLYNQLDVISWMARSHHADDVVEAIRLLSNFYRQALSRGKDVVTLEEELRHVQTYMDLQRLHYGESITLKIEQAENTSQCLVLKMLLQPLVENAIIHGILEKDEPKGNILITVSRNEDLLTIAVSDDGVGIAPGVLEKLISGQPASKRGGGYGYTNVLSRIQAYFGKGYGLRVENRVHGCAVIITLPVVMC